MVRRVKFLPPGRAHFSFTGDVGWTTYYSTRVNTILVRLSITLFSTREVAAQYKKFPLLENIVLLLLLPILGSRDNVTLSLFPDFKLLTFLVECFLAGKKSPEQEDLFPGPVHRDLHESGEATTDEQIFGPEWAMPARDCPWSVVRPFTHDDLTHAYAFRSSECFSFLFSVEL